MTKMTLVREYDGIHPGSDSWPGTDHEAAVEDLKAGGCRETSYSTWNTELVRPSDGHQFTVTTINR